MSEMVETVPERRRHIAFTRRVEALDRRHLFLITLFFAILIYLPFRFWQAPSTGDRANWDYFAQVIARGGVPYRDVVNIKTPLSAYLGAAAIVAARPFGVRDIFAIRVTHFFLGALVVAFTFLVANDYFKSRFIGALAATIMVGIDMFARTVSGGIQPKVPLVLFALMTLWAVIRDRPFWAGVCGMLAALCWQPGLLFVGVAGLAFSRYLTNWRDLKVVKLIAGALVPLVLLLAHLGAAGALKDFFHWTLEFNYSVYAPRSVRTVGGFFERFFEMLGGTFKRERPYFYLAALGLVIILFQEVKRAAATGLRAVLERAPLHAIAIPPVLYFLFCMVNMQGGGDMIPFLPLVAILAAFTLAFLLESIAGFLSRLRPRLEPDAVKGALSAAALAWVFAAHVADAILAKPRSPSLAQQEAEVAEIVANLQPGEKMFIHGQSEVMVLSGLPNASKYFFLDRGKDTYLDRVEPGGFAGWFERLQAERPRVVVLQRIKKWDHREDFFNWVHQDYEKRQGRIFTYYVRKADR